MSDGESLPMSIVDHIFKEELLSIAGDRLSGIAVTTWWDESPGIEAPLRETTLYPLKSIRDSRMYTHTEDGYPTLPCGVHISIHIPIYYKYQTLDIVLHCTRVVEKSKDSGNIINLGEHVVYKDWYIDKCSVLLSGIHLEFFHQLQHKLNNV
jgi:hypothetical protein